MSNQEHKQIKVIKKAARDLNADGGKLNIINVQGNTAGSIIVNTDGGGEILTEYERELLRIYRSFCIKNQIRYLKIGHDIENEAAG